MSAVEIIAAIRAAGARIMVKNGELIIDAPAELPRDILDAIFRMAFSVLEVPP